MRRKWLVRILVSVFAVVAILGAIAATTGRGARGEFSPDTLDIRLQRELLFMLTDTPLYQSSFEYYQNDLVRYLIEQGYWSPRDVAEPRWIQIFHYNVFWRDGGSRLFQRPESWIEWTEQNPRLAAVIWPQVLRVLRNEKYGEASVSYAEYMLWVASQAGSLREFERRMSMDIDWPKNLEWRPEE
jgi:hypothetical protein